MTITHDTMTVETVLHAVRQLAPSILDRAGEIETGRRVPPDLVDELRAAGCFRLVRPATHGGSRGLDPRRDARARVAGPGRRVGRLDRDDRCRVLDRPRPPSPGDLRRALRHQPRRHHRRRVQPDRLDHPGRRRLPGQRSLELRQRVRARRRDLRQRRGRHRRRHAAAARRRVRPRRRHHRGHLVGVRALRHRQPPLPRRRRHRPRRAHLRPDGRRALHRRADRAPATAGRLLAGDGQRRARHRPGRARRHHACWRRTRCRCSHRSRSAETRCSSSTWPPPTPTCGPREASSTTRPRRSGRPRRRATR